MTADSHSEEPAGNGLATDADTRDGAVASRIPMIVSVDDHVVEPPHVWQQWLPAKYREAGPRVERHRLGELSYTGGTSYDYDLDPADGSGDWCDIWFYEDGVYPHKRHVAAVGFDRDDMTLAPITYDEMRPGCYEPKARAADMLANHVDLSLSFPTFPRFCGQTFYEGRDKDLGLACIRAYNDWMVEEWCAQSDGVLVPLIIIPLWDAELAAAEVLRNAERGCRAVCFSEIPPHLGLPSIHTGFYEPFITACEDTGTVICMHIGSSSKMPATSADAPTGVAATLSFNNAMASLSDWLFSGILPRHRSLKIAYSEGQIGWLPYILERADTVWEEHRAWADTKRLVPEPPSTYWYRHGFGCFFQDRHGLASLDEVGVDNVTFETDYPHTDSTWPDTLEVATEMFADLDDVTIYKIVRGNALRMLELQD